MSATKKCSWLGPERDFDFEISNLEDVVAAVRRRVDSAKEDLNAAQTNLDNLRAEKQKAFEKAHSGTRVEPIADGKEGYLVARGPYLNTKYFSFHVDGLPSWNRKPWCAAMCHDQATAEAEVKAILEGERERRKEQKA